MKRADELYACVYAREFPAQAMLRLRPALRSGAVAILQGEAPRQFVCSRNARAAVLGVSAGMTRAELDVFPTVAVLSRSLTEEDSARMALLACAGQFSPRVEDRSEETCFCAVLDIAGTEKLFGPAEVVAKKLLHTVRMLGVHAAVVVSSNVDAAICRARSLHGGWAVIPRGREAAVLAPLPVAVLPMTAEHAETLARWGIGTLGELAELPEKEIIARLGQEGKRLRQLARGEAEHLLVPAPPVFALEERIELDSPVELLDSLLFVLGVLLDALIARATAHIVALAAVTVELKLEGGGTHTRTVRPALPGNDRRLWLKLLQLDLQAYPPGAEIVAVTMTAEPGSTSKVQLGLFSPQLPEPSRLDVTLARIRSMVGEERVGRPVLEDTHRPDAFRVEPFAIPQGSPARAPRGRARGAVRRLRPPELVPVTLRDRRPITFVFHNQRYVVQQSFGPWFSSGNWWGAEIWSMEKWDLIARAGDETICCCLARHPQREDWRIEALYD
ncbi:MAG TPA: DNA polymerase Y family protein [Acidobacteriaceae bacterium]|nr:DNA polymerase Y family protein [Acidobacteriaceae bacterium]